MDGTITGKWRNILIQKCLLIAGIITITEIIMYFFDDWAGLMFLSAPAYIMRFIIVPTVFNFSVVFMGYKIIYSPKYSDDVKNIVSCMAFFLICACVELTHYVFAPIFCATGVSIFVSIIFNSRKLTRMMMYLSIVTLFLATFIASLELRKDDPQLILDAVVAFVITICSYIVARVLIQLETDRSNEMVANYISQKQLSEQVRRDTLTGLFNRKVLFEKLEQQISEKINIQEQNGLQNKESSQYKDTGKNIEFTTDVDVEKNLYLVIIDIDNFKSINDTFGHAKGDIVLIYLGHILKKNTQKAGIAARFGGEEFAIIFQDAQYGEVMAKIEKIRKELAEHSFQLDNSEKVTHVTISIGVARYVPGQNMSQLFEEADQAMYQAKREGKNRIIQLH